MRKKFDLEEIFYRGILWIPINCAGVLAALINVVQILQEIITQVLQGIKDKAIVLYKRILKER